MNEFTIFCTEEQLKKILELGAPIEIYDTFDSYDIKESNIFYKDKFIELADGRLMKRVTAEQMSGWLEKNHVRVYAEPYKDLDNNLWYKPKIHTVGTITLNHRLSRKEAILASIDAALKYLEEQKLLK